MSSRISRGRGRLREYQRGSQNRGPASSRPDGPAIREEAMKINRRNVISAISAAAAAASLGLAEPSRAADTKEIVYLTPGLNLPFWRYLSNGIESEAKKAGFSYTALDS